MEELIRFLRRVRDGRPSTKWTLLRYYPRWKRSRQPGASSIDQRLPWLSFPAIDYLKRAARPTHRVFEFGGGGSTLFWADRVAEVVTVEHNAEWFAALQLAMAKGARAKWTGIHLAAEPALGAALDSSDPEHFASSDDGSRGMHYRNYVEAILAYPDEYFDIIVIDGRARTSCLAVSVPKLRPGGLLVLDNAERAHYTSRNASALRALDAVVQGLAPVAFGDFSETRIYRKRA